MTGTDGVGVVIVGAGLAGAKTAEGLREKGYEGSITVIGNEEHLPYERPPLSKDFFWGDQELSDFTVHPQDWYTENSIDVRLGTTVTAIEPDSHQVVFEDDTRLDYSALVLATGSSSLVPGLPGATAKGVHYLRTVDQSADLRDSLHEGVRLVIIGGGWIGLEIAAGARKRGASVTVVDRSPQPLFGPLGPEMGAMFAGLHKENGVEFRGEVSVASITTSEGHATGIELGDGSRIEGDVVLVAVGARPNISLAEAAGLDMAIGGVKVDSGLRTSAPDVYAVGDIAAWHHPVFEELVRSEHWANALNHPAVAVANILGGDESYELLPYFYTDQYDLGMEFSGHPVGYDKVLIRGEVTSREFIAFWLDANDVVLAGMNVNIWDVTDDIGALVRSRKPVDVDRLVDADVPLADLLS